MSYQTSWWLLGTHPKLYPPSDFMVKGSNVLNTASSNAHDAPSSVKHAISIQSVNRSQGSQIKYAHKPGQLLEIAYGLRGTAICTRGEVLAISAWNVTYGLCKSSDHCRHPF